MDTTTAPGPNRLIAVQETHLDLMVNKEAQSDLVREYDDGLSSDQKQQDAPTLVDESYTVASTANNALRCQGALDTTQQQDSKLQEQAQNLVEMLDESNKECLGADEGAMELPADMVALPLNRLHNASGKSRLLALPDCLLESIATKMGKRSRLLCSRLLLLFGSPGSALCSRHAQLRHHDAPAFTDVLTSWRYLSTLRKVILDEYTRWALPSFSDMPALQELTVAYFCRLPPTPHPTLTRLCLRSAFNLSPADLGRLATLTPSLRSLDIDCNMSSCEPEDYSWEGLVASSNLQHLRMTLPTCQLTCAAFPAAMRSLTRITRLELDLVDGWEEQLDPSPTGARSLQRGLLGLPLLVSIHLSCFRSLQPFRLSAALQALSTQLTCLELNDLDEMALDRGDPECMYLAPLTGCLPKISSMAALRRLEVSGHALVGTRELEKACSGGSATLGALVLHNAHYTRLGGISKLLACGYTGLTELRLDFDTASKLWGKQRDQFNRQLSEGLRQHTSLQWLAVRSCLHGFMPWLQGLPDLVRLELGFEGNRGEPVLESDVKVVEQLTTLTKLALGRFAAKEGCRIVRGVEAARKLPRLEELELSRVTAWEAGVEEEVRLLVPPPGLLKRLTLSCAQGWVPKACWKQVAELESYDVVVTLA